MKINKVQSYPEKTTNFKSNLTQIAGWNINRQALHNVDKFITKNNAPLVEAIKTNYRLKETAPLDLFITQNMKIGRNEVNDIRNFRDFVMDKILDLGFKDNFIGNAKMAITATLSKALLTKEADNKPPSACGTQEHYKYYFPDYERFAIQQGNLGDCYFLAALDSLIKKDSGYEYVTSLFKNDLTCDMKIGIKPKNYETEVNFIKDDLAYWASTKLRGATPLWTKTLEIAFAKMTNQDLYNTILKYRKEEHIDIEENWNGKHFEESLFTKNSVFGKINVLGNAGYSNVAFRLLGLKNVKDYNFYPYGKQQLINTLEKDNAFICTGISEGVTIPQGYSECLINHHAYSLHKYDKENDLFIISNPHYSAVDIKVDWDFLCNTCHWMISAELPDRNTWYEYHPPYREPEWYELPDKECAVNWDMYL